MIRPIVMAIVALGAALSAGSAAFAQMAVAPEVALRFLDADKDGKVSLDEYRANQTAMPFCCG